MLASVRALAGQQNCYGGMHRATVHDVWYAILALVSFFSPETLFCLQPWVLWIPNIPVCNLD